jgi:hypothetical protein
MGLRGPKPGTRLSESHKQKLRDARAGIPPTAAQQEALKKAQHNARLANTGRPRSDATRAKLSASRKGMRLPESWINAIRKANKNKPRKLLTNKQFLGKLVLIPETGCLVWQKLAPNYGLVTLNGRRIATHRAAWQIAHGPIPDGLLVCHHCDVKRCCNAEHLFLGSHFDNCMDMVNKGKHPRGTLGMKSWNSGLTKYTDMRVRKNGEAVGIALLRRNSILRKQRECQ